MSQQLITIDDIFELFRESERQRKDQQQLFLQSLQEQKQTSEQSLQQYRQTAEREMAELRKTVDRTSQ